jgi:AraC-like DNA-binding protein
VEAVRSRIVASLPKAFAVDALAAEYGMSRSHFSHFFRARTGLTPARFATEVRIHEATRLLLDTRAPMKRIADACGFANANHFCKVFRRFQHLSPAAYRQAIR